MNDKLFEIEEVLGFKLKAGLHDLELFEHEWNAFYQDPRKYAGSVVIDMIAQWYSGIYPFLFMDMVYLTGSL